MRGVGVMEELKTGGINGEMDGWMDSWKKIKKNWINFRIRGWSRKEMKGRGN